MVITPIQNIDAIIVYTCNLYVFTVYSVFQISQRKPEILNSKPWAP